MIMIILCSQTLWQPVINAIPGICWGIITFFFIYILFRYLIKPLIANCHERALKEQSFSHEKDWAKYNETKASTDENLKQQVKELKSERETLQTDIIIMKKQMETYEKFFGKLSLEMKHKGLDNSEGEEIKNANDRVNEEE